jgi:hypothetical protein
MAHLADPGGLAMHERPRWVPWLLSLVVALGVGAVAYNAGVAHGLAAAPAPAGTTVPPHLWYHPFGFFFPLFLLFAFFFLARVLVWGGYRRRWHHGGYPGVPPAFEEWHRRAHEADRQPREPKDDR